MYIQDTLLFSVVVANIMLACVLIIELNADEMILLVIGLIAAILLALVN